MDVVAQHAQSNALWLSKDDLPLGAADSDQATGDGIVSESLTSEWHRVLADVFQHLARLGQAQAKGDRIIMARDPQLVTAPNAAGETVTAELANDFLRKRPAILLAPLVVVLD